MKTNPFVASQARKVRKHYFNATKEEKHVALSAPINKELQTTHGIKRLPIRRDDEVQVVRGQFKGRSGRVVAVKLRSMRINVESVTKQKINNETVFIPIHPSNVVITKLKMDKYRKTLIEKKKLGRDKALEKLGRGSQ
ncbi:60S ribosomal protein L26 [Tritrichomonas musculus]|uniref:60S ribosomal protein L26 n=1 Tax=Tritrichomonas musculus TaxID=1915356 RepID=A0ABR2K874_9EUKA